MGRIRYFSPYIRVSEKRIRLYPRIKFLFVTSKKQEQCCTIWTYIVIGIAGEGVSCYWLCGCCGCRDGRGGGGGCCCCGCGCGCSCSCKALAVAIVVIVTVLLRKRIESNRFVTDLYGIVKIFLSSDIKHKIRIPYFVQDIFRHLCSLLPTESGPWRYIYKMWLFLHSLKLKHLQDDIWFFVSMEFVLLRQWV